MIARLLHSFAPSSLYCSWHAITYQSKRSRYLWLKEIIFKKQNQAFKEAILGPADMVNAQKDCAIYKNNASETAKTTTK